MQCIACTSRLWLYYLNDNWNHLQRVWIDSEQSVAGHQLSDLTD
jgi:hypothetical protein